MPSLRSPVAPGAHIEVRDAIWRVQKVDLTSDGTHAWHCVGVSGLVKNQDAIFLEAFEPDWRVLDPAEVSLVDDRSSGHLASRLHLESLLREVPPTGAELVVGHKAAMDVLPFQLEPADLALRATRARILIADAVGLGKTLEAGILLSELIRRGRGRRILVATVKSMLTQFQKEMWCRFAIPLVRLDTAGLQRIRERIPTNHNPFHVYDRAIISIDTLKQNNAFRAHVEQARWDVIVIDEAHNVAERGGGKSQRSRIARVLSERADNLILLSATPHDGRARSFASLMNMLDPTAIADPERYTRGDIEGLFIRRFKGDVKAQLKASFPERTIAAVHAQASPAEEAAFSSLAELSFKRIDAQAHGGLLFKTTLEKSLFSSPAACAATLDARIKRDRARDNAADYADDVAALEALKAAVDAIAPEDFSKYQRLKALLGDKRGPLSWSPRDKADRLVIFSERIETLRFLQTHLCADLGLKEGQVALLTGTLGDQEQQEIVERFGKESDPLRLLLASDVASEGLNLHYLCHKLIHFDVPWSLMVFQQRNGRIDRYGQEQAPKILYLLTDAANEKIRGDTHILELLIAKDEQATLNIQDPSALMGAYDVDSQEIITGRAMEEGRTAEELDASLTAEGPNPMELLLRGLLGAEPAPAQASGMASLPPLPPSAAPVPRELPSLFADDFDFAARGLDLLRTDQVHSRVDRPGRTLHLTLPPDLRRRFAKLPDEVFPADGVVALTPDVKAMQRAIRDARREESAWPDTHFLWANSPTVEWLRDRLRHRFGRHAAPVITVLGHLRPEAAVVLVSGLIPNRRGQPMIHAWFATCFEGGALSGVEPFEAFLARAPWLRQELPNRAAADLEALRPLIPRAIEAAEAEMNARREVFQAGLRARLAAEEARLTDLRDAQLALLPGRFPRPGQREERAAEERRIHHLFKPFREWVREAMTIDDDQAPFLQVLAVLCPEPADGAAS